MVDYVNNYRDGVRPVAVKNMTGENSTSNVCNMMVFLFNKALLFWCLRVGETTMDIVGAEGFKETIVIFATIITLELLKVAGS